MKQFISRIGFGILAVVLFLVAARLTGAPPFSRHSDKPSAEARILHLEQQVAGMQEEIEILDGHTNLLREWVFALQAQVEELQPNEPTINNNPQLFLLHAKAGLQ